VRQLVRDHTFELAPIQQRQQSAGDDQRGVLRIAANGERVRRRRFDDMNGRLGKARTDAQVLYRAHELRLSIRLHRPGARHPKNRVRAVTGNEEDRNGDETQQHCHERQGENATLQHQSRGRQIRQLERPARFRRLRWRPDDGVQRFRPPNPDDQVTAEQ
jgi:hypothetical protein